MPDKHALLSASSAHRWLMCPPSVRLTERIPDTGSPYAAEGTCAHLLAETKVRRMLGQVVDDPTEDMIYYDQTMEEASDGYAAFISEIVADIRKTCSDPLVMVEQQLDFTKWVPDGFGTADCVIVGEGILHVVDLKYGKLEVSAIGNPQMRLYALGALELYGDLYGVDEVQMHIFQPRLDAISSDAIAVNDLLDWAENTLRPIAQLAYEGKGEQAAGEWCRFCKIRATCRKRADEALKMTRYDFQLPPTLRDDEIAGILDQLDELTSWAETLREYALQAALRGKEFPGWKVVAGRANRKFTDENAVAAAVMAAGGDPYEKKLLGISAMERMLGKKKFSELLDGLVERPEGKPTLVHDTDKRPEIRMTAKQDFAD